ncbi:nuclear transport factor 2 family protein [Zymobacter palmae]|uniref:Transcription termination factor n=1 Tax=Zymobacter palmae TaxID=33074 RepID=A0A348HCU2_9GAMM|nr:DUF4878 domain-containing protein [Zymobacter palmae]BBG29444.1 transcription termination factor [Zymobacter palmae]
MKIKMMLGSIVLATTSLMTISAQAAVATTPEQAVQGYFSTLERGDENGFFELMKMPEAMNKLPAQQQTEAKHQVFAGMQGAVKQEGGLKSLEVSKAQAGQDSAHMIVHYKAVTNSGQTHEEDVPVVKVGTYWKVGQ